MPCSRRDVATVFGILNGLGVSQRRIAASVGITQGEVSEIIKGKRIVQSAELLERIADGLGMPRAWWRLSGDHLSEAARALEVAQQLMRTVTLLVDRVAALTGSLAVDEETA